MFTAHNYVVQANRQRRPDARRHGLWIRRCGADHARHRAHGRISGQLLLARRLRHQLVADPKEQLVVVLMAATPGPIRWHYRYVVNAIVNQAIVD